MNSCKLTTGKLEDCTRYKKGAVLLAICITDFGNTMFHVDCDSVFIGMVCDSTPIEKDIPLHFDESYVNENSIARCLAYSQEFSLKAYLHIVPKTILHRTTHKCNGAKRRD
uniref:DNA-directed DNA polymerase n=1 Tax=Acrobeloides nanus TaxID=290746 RepID=A0A914CHH0_9BILA